MLDQPTSRNLDVALDLARAGAFVFPCRGSGPEEDLKKPCHLVYWKSASTRDESEILAFWRKFPDAVPGIDLRRSGFLVIDADKKLNDGLSWLIEHARQNGDALDDVPTSDTPRGGRHFYYRNTFDPPHGNKRGVLPPKTEADIDVRGAGGYVIAPGARFADGREYAASGSIFDAGPPPAWLVELLEPAAAARVEPIVISVPVGSGDLAAYGAAALTEEARRVASAPKGDRNNTLNAATFSVAQLAPHILPTGVVVDAMSAAAQAAGLSAPETRATIRSALRAGMAQPRTPADSTQRVEISLDPVRRVVTAPDGTLADADTGEVVEEARRAEAVDYPDHLLEVPGLIGDITAWIMSTSMFPCRLFATAAALAMVGTAVGRQVYTGTPRTGTALYWLTVAPTGGGKDRPQEAIKQVFEAAGLSHLVRSSVSSSAKLGLSLAEKPLQVQVIDEVGKVLRKFVGRNASTQEMALLDDYCTVWGRNLGTFMPEGVTTRSDVTIKRPSLTLFGATTPVNFYAQLRSNQVAGGFLNRFIVLHRFERVERSDHIVPEEQVPPMLVEAMQALHTFQDGAVQAHSSVATLPDHVPQLFVVPADATATRLMDEHYAKAREMVLRSDADPIYEIWVRAAEMVKRLSLILACARHWRDLSHCEVQAEDVRWAAGLVDWSMGTFIEGLRNHMAETEHQANTKMVAGIIRGAGRITRNQLVRRLDGRLDGRVMDSVVKSLIEGGSVEQVKEEAGPKGGRPKTIYLYRGDQED
ncbi:MAG: bifunctional DNA primase/polymerase [Rhodovulum sp.]|nr:bifunctional DNA primase/polymerase [Rhodovulum sp.]